MHPLYGAMPSCAECASAGYKRCSGHTLVHLLDSSLQNLAVGPLLASQCHIFLTFYSMVWDWPVSITGPIHFYWPIGCFSPFVSYYFYISFRSVFTLILWGWGLWTGRV